MKFGVSCPKIGLQLKTVNMTIKEKITEEYLVGKMSMREIADKYGFGKTSIHRWVMEYERASGSKAAILEELTSPPMDKKDERKDLPDDVAQLKKELEEERLRNKLLTAMIEVAEEELKIPIRKKYGTKPLKK